eukprot:SAG11_NODE_12139_length_720_cov_0.903382_1_plen_78_part_00
MEVARRSFEEGLRENGTWLELLLHAATTTRIDHHKGNVATMHAERMETMRDVWEAADGATVRTGNAVLRQSLDPRIE